MWAGGDGASEKGWLERDVENALEGNKKKIKPHGLGCKASLK